MTREEKYASIYTHDTVYRPPQEADSAMLEVALGCSWGKCAFCDFAKDAFRLLPLEQVKQNLIGLSELGIKETRLFLLGENAFVMETDRLLEVIQLTRDFLPDITEFSMYARVDDVLRKSQEELNLVKEKGVCTLHIGVESGSDPILALMNKGVTSFDMLNAFQRLDKAGIEYYVTVILGLGGRAYRNLHALETSRLLNRTHPKGIWCLALKLWPNTPLEKLARRGEFELMSSWEMLLEERILLENLTVQDCFYMDSTVLGSFTIQGFLPEGKESMLGAVNRLLYSYMPKERRGLEL